MLNRKFKLAICISGGLDSYTAVHYAKDVFCPKMEWDFKNDVILIEVQDSSNPYGYKEAKVVQELYHKNKDMCLVYTVRIDGFTHLASTGSHVVLARNPMIASIAGSCAPLVWINGTAYENNKEMYDKNNEFFNRMSFLLDYACRYTRFEPTRVMSPFQGAYYNVPSDTFKSNMPNWEKTEMILWLEEQGHTRWRETTSCFHPEHLRCGECAVCGKRFIYEALAEEEVTYSFFGKPLEQTFFKNPLSNQSMLKTMFDMYEAVKANDFSRYKKERIEIYAKVLARYGSTVAEDTEQLLGEKGIK